MADFSIAYPLVISGEGYYVSQEYWRAHGDNVSGETYMGVDRIQNPKWGGWAIIDQYKVTNGPIPYDTELPASLGLELLVEAISKKNYWDTFQGDNIKTQDIATLIFEMNYMSGSFGIKQVQQSINEIIAPKQIVVDGGIGSITIGYINNLYQPQLYAAIYNKRKAWYLEEQQQGNADAAGWLTRLAKLPAEILSA
jgi:hypothetical protein